MWNDIKFMMRDKSLGVLGAAVANVQKSLDDKLKKKLDEQSLIKSKLQALTKKQGNTLNQKDLSDCVYEKIKEIGKGKFITSIHPEGENYSTLLTSILVVVGKKKDAQFRDNYFRFLIDHNVNDYENWRKRTEMACK